MVEYAVVNDYNVAVVPKAVSDVHAAMIEPAAVAVYAADRGGETSGSTVLISGLGPIGALTLLAVRAAGAAVIFVSEPKCLSPRSGKAASAGCDLPRSTKDDVPAFIRAHTGEGVGVDVAIECERAGRGLEARSIASFANSGHTQEATVVDLSERDDEVIGIVNPSHAKSVVAQTRQRRLG